MVVAAIAFLAFIALIAAWVILPDSAEKRILDSERLELSGSEVPAQ